jgi:ABC-type antimicrobial peptide transport system permease subunit
MFTVISAVAVVVAILAAGLTLALCRFVHSCHRPLRWFHGIAGGIGSGLLLSGVLWCRDALSDLSFQKIIGVDLVPITMLSAVTVGVITGVIVVRRFTHDKPVA